MPPPPFTGGVFHPTSREEVRKRFECASLGSTVDISDISIGLPPKHLSGKTSLLVTEQLLTLHLDINSYFSLPSSSSSVGSIEDISQSISSLSLDSSSSTIADNKQLQLLKPLCPPTSTTSSSSSSSSSSSTLTSTSASEKKSAKALASTTTAKPAAASQCLRQVLCGPMGMGKSFICWALAAMNYALGRRVLYIGDAGEWMDVPSERHVRYLINVYLSLNSDLLEASVINQLQSPTCDWGYFREILRDQAVPTAVIVDEHSAIVPKFEYWQAHEAGSDLHCWVSSFIHLNIWEGAFNTVVLFCGSSHGAFELKYMKNGMQSFKRYLVPVTEQEATLMMKLEGVPHDFLQNQSLVQLLLTVTNRVPREISHFAKFLQRPVADYSSSHGASPAKESKYKQQVKEISNPSSKATKRSATASSSSSSSSLAVMQSATNQSYQGAIQSFIDWRKDQIEQEASKYYMGLQDEDLRKNYVDSLAGLFSRSSFPHGGGDTYGFFDLGLCYRYHHPTMLGLVVRPLCFAATAGLLQSYHNHSQCGSLYEKIGRMNTLKGEDFEDLVWHLITRDGVVNSNSIPCYYLNGKPAALLQFDWSDFYTLEEDDPPLVFRDQNILYRCPPGFPRWDFLAHNVLIQVSKSTFDKHNTGSADISKSFQNDAFEIIHLLNRLHSGAHSWVKKELKHKGETIVQHELQRDGESITDFHIVYVTLSKPNHPILFKEFPFLRVIAAEEVWNRL